MKVTAKVRRSGGWWAIEVPEVEGVFTQAKRLDQVPDTVADAVRTMLDLRDDAAVEVDVQPDIGSELQQRVHAALSAAREATAAQEIASKETRLAVARLRDEGMPVRDVAALLKVSHQRVSQLANSDSRVEVTVTHNQRGGGKTISQNKSNKSAGRKSGTKSRRG